MNNYTDEYLGLIECNNVEISSDEVVKRLNKFSQLIEAISRLEMVDIENFHDCDIDEINCSIFELNSILRG